MKTILFIFLGGGLGSVTRYILGSWISKIYQNPFPLGTLTVNIVACLLVGLAAGAVEHRTAARAFLVIGFCGGFSTFSTFTSESAQLVGGHLTASAILYMVVSLIGCLGATFLGLWIGGRT